MSISHYHVPALCKLRRQPHAHAIPGCISFLLATTLPLRLFAPRLITLIHSVPAFTRPSLVILTASLSVIALTAISPSTTARRSDTLWLPLWHSSRQTSVMVRDLERSSSYHRRAIFACIAS
jgi:hypothetical protein